MASSRIAQVALQYKPGVYRRISAYINSGSIPPRADMLAALSLGFGCICAAALILGAAFAAPGAGA